MSASDQTVQSVQNHLFNVLDSFLRYVIIQPRLSKFFNKNLDSTFLLDENGQPMMNSKANQQSVKNSPEQTQTQTQEPGIGPLSDEPETQVIKSVELETTEQQALLVKELNKAGIAAEMPSSELAVEGHNVVTYAVTTPEETAVAEQLVGACAGKDVAIIASLPNDSLGKLFKESMSDIGIDVPIMKDVDLVDPSVSFEEVGLFDRDGNEGLLRAWVLPEEDVQRSVDRATALSGKIDSWWQENGKTVPADRQHETAKADIGGWWQETVFRTSSAYELPENMRVHHIRYEVPENDRGAKLLTDRLAGMGVEYHACGWETLASGAAVATLAVTESQLPAAEKAIDELCKSTKGIARDANFDISGLETHMDLDKAIAEAKAAIEAMANPVQTIGLEVAKTYAPDKGPR